MNWYLVVSLSDTRQTTQTAYPTREHADAVCALKNIEYPSIGPWVVVPLVTLPASNRNTEPTTTGTPVTRDEE